LKLLSETNDVRSKVDELVYDYDQQTPTDDSDNGWKIIIRQNTSLLPIEINTKNNGVIELEFLEGDQPVPTTINTAVPYLQSYIRTEE